MLIVQNLKNCLSKENDVFESFYSVFLFYQGPPSIPPTLIPAHPPRIQELGGAMEMQGL